MAVPGHETQFSAPSSHLFLVHPMREIYTIHMEKSMMIREIEDILEQFAKLQCNLGSQAARRNIAETISEHLFIPEPAEPTFYKRLDRTREVQKVFPE